MSKPAPARAALGAPSEEALQANARLLESVLADYGVQGQIVEILPGPVVTLYELEPAPGIRRGRQAGRGYAHVRPGFVRRTKDDAAELP